MSAVSKALFFRVSNSVLKKAIAESPSIFDAMHRRCRQVLSQGIALFERVSNGRKFGQLSFHAGGSSSNSCCAVLTVLSLGAMKHLQINSHNALTRIEMIYFSPLVSQRVLEISRNS